MNYSELKDKVAQLDEVIREGWKKHEAETKGTREALNALRNQFHHEEECNVLSWDGKKASIVVRLDPSMRDGFSVGIEKSCIRMEDASTATLRRVVELREIAEGVVKGERDWPW